MDSQIIKVEGKKCYKMNFRPEHAEYISYVYLLNQIFESVLSYLRKRYQNGCNSAAILGGAKSRRNCATFKVSITVQWEVQDDDMMTQK